MWFSAVLKQKDTASQFIVPVKLQNYVLVSVKKYNLNTMAILSVFAEKKTK